MRQIFILTILLTANSLLLAQELPKFIQDRIKFCDANFSDNQVAQLRKELNQLEDYLVMKGLLADRSGTSYRAVYEHIIIENDLNFEIDIAFELLDTLEFQVYTGCFYKILTPHQLSQLTIRHQDAADRIAKGYTGEVSPRLVAQRIIDNLTVQDFELEYYRVSSLLTFYKIAYLIPKLDFGSPEFNQNTNADFVTIKVVLNENSQIEIVNDILTLKEAEYMVYQFLRTDPEMKGVELSASRGASYKSYIELTGMLNSVYSTLEKELGTNISKNIIFNEPK